MTALRGVGPSVAGLIEKVASGGRVLDLLFHLPESYIDRRLRPTLRTAKPGQVATIAIEVWTGDPQAEARWFVTAQRIVDSIRFLHSLSAAQSPAPP